MIATSNNQIRFIRWLGAVTCAVVVLCFANAAMAQDETTQPVDDPAASLTDPADPANPLEEMEETVGPEIKEELQEEVEGLAHEAAGTPSEPEKAEEGGHGGHGGHGGKEESNPMEKYSPLWVNLDLAVWTAVVFILLVFVLGKFAWGPIARGLDKREQGIADTIAEANQANEDAKSALAEYKAQLAQAREEVRVLMAEARQEAEKTRTEIVEKARMEATAQQHRALEQIEAATGAALKTVAAQGADMAVRLAGQILQSELRPEDHRRLIDQAVNDMSSGESAS